MRLETVEMCLKQAKNSAPLQANTPSASTQDLTSLTSTRYKISTDGKNVTPQRVENGEEHFWKNILEF